MKLSKIRSMVKTYFRGVDDEDLSLLLGTLSEECVFSIETHGIKLIGHDAISGMFHRLWSNHKWVRHDQFSFVEDTQNDAIAVRFMVTNQLPDDKLVYKSNCNIFTLKGNKFSEVRVYMSGENTLDHANQS